MVQNIVRNAIFDEDTSKALLEEVASAAALRNCIGEPRDFVPSSKPDAPRRVLDGSLPIEWKGGAPPRSYSTVVGSKDGTLSVGLSFTGFAIPMSSVVPQPGTYFIRIKAVATYLGSAEVFTAQDTRSDYTGAVVERSFKIDVDDFRFHVKYEPLLNEPKVNVRQEMTGSGLYADPRTDPAPIDVVNHVAKFAQHLASPWEKPPPEKEASEIQKEWVAEWGLPPERDEYDLDTDFYDGGFSEEADPDEPQSVAEARAEFVAWRAEREKEWQEDRQRWLEGQENAVDAYNERRQDTIDNNKAVVLSRLPAAMICAGMAALAELAVFQLLYVPPHGPLYLRDLLAEGLDPDELPYRKERRRALAREQGRAPADPAKRARVEAALFEALRGRVARVKI